jgi:hypothetical protein
MTTSSIIGFISLLTSVAARAAENSDFSIISLHGGPGPGMISHIDFTRGETMLSLLGFAALAAVIAFRLWKAKQVPTRS